MSFNEKTGKIQEKRFSMKENRPDFHRKSVLIVEENPNLKSERETNIESYVNDKIPIIEDSRFILPSIIRKRTLQDTKTTENKTQLKNIIFTEEKDSKGETSEENLFTVEENQESSQKPEKNVAWYKKLRKKEQNIILNYLNTKIETSKPKKVKKNVKKSMSNEKVVQNKEFSASSFQRHRRNLSEIKTKKLDKISINSAAINRGQSFQNYQEKSLSIPVSKTDKFGKESETFGNLKQIIRKMKEQQKEENEEKKLNVTENLHLKNQENLKANVFEKEIAKERRRKSEHPNKLFFETLQGNSEESQITKKYESDESIINQRFEHSSFQNNPSNDASQFETMVKTKSQMSEQKDSKTSDFTIRPILQCETSKEENPTETIINLSEGMEKETILVKETFKSEEPSHNEIAVEQAQKIEPQCMKKPTHIPDKSFLKIKTYYAQVDKKINSDKTSTEMIKHSSLKISFKKLPSSNEIVDFVEKYTPENDELKIQELMKHENFKVLLEEGKELYFGSMDNDKKSGFGVTIKEKYSFEGLYLEGQKVRGIEINEVGKYIGDFLKNKRSGKGEFLWKNGEQYFGEWRNGKKHGKGTWTSLNGDIYDGEWVEGKVEGYGIHKSSNGQHYEGFFHKYLKSGQGKEILPNGEEYVGEFSKGKPQGKGKYIWVDSKVYEGDFELGFRNGFGILSDREGNTYKGCFKNEEASGECEIHFSSQDFYQGSILNGQFNGQGTLKLHDQQSLWTGHWALDEFVESSEPIEN